MHTRSKRWIAFLLISAALGVAWFVWHTLHAVPPLDMRTEASQSDAIVYGGVRDESGRRQVVVEEIWKPATDAEVHVGSAIPVPQLPRDAHPEHLVVFLERSSRDGRLHAGTIVAVYHGRLSWPEMSVEEAKAICSRPQASNHAMERTPTGFAFTRCVAKMPFMFSTLTPSRRRSSCSR